MSRSKLHCPESVVDAEKTSGKTDFHRHFWVITRRLLMTVGGEGSHEKCTQSIGEMSARTGEASINVWMSRREIFDGWNEVRSVIGTKLLLI